MIKGGAAKRWKVSMSPDQSFKETYSEKLPEKKKKKKHIKLLLSKKTKVC